MIVILILKTLERAISRYPDNGSVLPRLLALLVLSGSLVAAASSASPSTPAAVVSASAYGISVSVSGQPGAAAASATAPGGASTGAADGFAYPADGLSARTGAQASSVSAQGVAAVSYTHLTLPTICSV